VGLDLLLLIDCASGALDFMLILLGTNWCFVKELLVVDDCLGVWPVVCVCLGCGYRLVEILIWSSFDGLIWSNFYGLRCVSWGCFEV